MIHTHLVEFLVDSPGDRRAVRGDDHHDHGEALLGVGPGLQPAKLERLLVVVTVSLLLGPCGPLAPVGLELLHPVVCVFS